MRTLTQHRVAIALRLIAIGLLYQSVSGEEFHYSAGRYKRGELRIINQIPVLIVSGDPEEIGEQIGILGMRPAPRLKDIPRDLLKDRHVEYLYSALLQVGKAMYPQFPSDYRHELEAIAKSAQVDLDLLTVVNTIDDIDRIGGCSSITIDAEHSTTGGPLMARNLDYYVPDYVPYFTLVTVYRPTHKHAFASVNFAGCLGVQSAINESGLTLAVHEVFRSADHSPSFAPDGTPMTLSFRRVMEECSTVAEAERLLRSVKRTTYLSVAVADRQSAVVLELTPKNVISRPAENGMLICTNHFRSPELRVNMECDRYEKLKEGGLTAKLDVPQLWRRLERASLDITFQSMIFEPTTLKLHLAFGKPPSTSQLPKTVELADLLR